MTHQINNTARNRGSCTDKTFKVKGFGAAWRGWHPQESAGAMTLPKAASLPSLAYILEHNWA